MTRDEMAIARTVIYASLFDYPLTLDQVRDTLIGATLTSEQIAATVAASPVLHTIVEVRDGFYFEAGRSGLVAERARRESRSRAFLSAHRRTLRLICALPFTRMVALSGSVAHLNLEQGGDLDLFVITRGRHVWTVSVALILLARMLGVRGVTCANFVIADTRLALDQQDLFAANQILHLRPLIGADVFERFVAANPFVRRCYPNWRGPAPFEFSLGPRSTRRPVTRLLEWLLAIPSPAIEWVCRRGYAWHLRRRSPGWRSPDQVRLQSDYLKLHTRSHRRSVLDRFDERVDAALGRTDRAAIA